MFDVMPPVAVVGQNTNSAGRPLPVSSMELPDHSLGAGAMPEVPGRQLASSSEPNTQIPKHQTHQIPTGLKNKQDLSSRPNRSRGRSRWRSASKRPMPNPDGQDDSSLMRNDHPTVGPNGRTRSGSKHPQRGVAGKSNLQTWASVAVAKAASKGYDLDFCPPTYVQDRAVLQMTEEDIDAADPLLQECLVGCYISRRIPFKVTEAAFRRAWGPNLAKVMANGKGLFFFHLSDREFRRKVLEGPPLSVSRIPIALQQWRPNLDFRKESFLSVPVWVKLKNLPIALWSAQAISKVASYVGKPLYVDLRTEQLDMLAFARACVEITARQQPCDSIEVVLQGESCIVEVEYEWKPLACVGCGVFGHKCKVPSAETLPKSPRDDGNASTLGPSSPPAQHLQNGERTRDNPLFSTRPADLLKQTNERPAPLDALLPARSLGIAPAASDCPPHQEKDLHSQSLLPTPTVDSSWQQVMTKKKKIPKEAVSSNLAHHSKDGSLKLKGTAQKLGPPPMPRKLVGIPPSPSITHTGSSVARPKHVAINEQAECSDEISSVHTGIEDEDLLSVGCPSPTSSPVTDLATIQDKLLLRPDPAPSLDLKSVPAKKKASKRGK